MGVALLSVTARTEYALRALVELARRHPAPTTARSLADTSGVPYRYLAGLLTDLARGGLVVGRRGGDGGYRLTRPPAEIDLHAVVEALEGSVAWLPAPPNDGPWQPAAVAVAAALARTTLGDLASSPGDGA